MAIQIQGVKLKQLSFTKNNEGQFEMTGSYELLSNTGVCLAKQSFNGYDSIKLTPSSDGQTAINKMLESLTTDLNKTLGME